MEGSSSGCNQRMIQEHIEKMSKLEQRVEDLDNAFERFVTKQERQLEKIDNILDRNAEQITTTAVKQDSLGMLIKDIKEDARTEGRKAGGKAGLLSGIPGLGALIKLIWEAISK